MRKILYFVVLLCAACGTASANREGIAVTVPADAAVNLSTVESTPLPTIPTSTSTPIPTATIAPTSTASSTATATFTPSVTPSATDTATTQPTAEPTITETLVPSASPTVELLRFVDHYLLSRPIAPQGIDYIDRTYAYGDTQRGRRETHLGVEFANPRGTPVKAAAGGTILYAGSDTDDSVMFGPQIDYYGNLVVIEHGFQTVDGLPVYTLYGHLDRITVETGQTVEGGDRIGVVGDSGIAMGPHLHFEVRAGDPYDYLYTQNPDLWLFPYPRFGTLAGRVVDSDGSLLHQIPVEIKALSEDASDAIRFAFTYAEDRANSTASWQENFTMGDLPIGNYEVRITDDGQVLFQTEVTIESFKTTWLEIVLE